MYAVGTTPGRGDESENFIWLKIFRGIMSLGGIFGQNLSLEQFLGSYIPEG